jgi:aminopeptidase N
MSTVEKFLSDYTTPTHAIVSCELTFTITDEYTIVGNRLQLEQHTDTQNTLTLAGVNLELLSIFLNNKQLSTAEYTIDALSLTIENLPERFTLDITTKIYPEKNTALEGLFKSGAIYCTQNEPE